MGVNNQLPLNQNIKPDKSLTAFMNYQPQSAFLSRVSVPRPSTLNTDYQIPTPSNLI